MEKFEEFYQALIEEGFHHSPFSVWCLFGDDVPDKDDIPWSECKEIFDKLCKEYSYEHIELKDDDYFCHGIVKVGNKYFKAEWNHTSYDGYSYDDIYETICEVKPVTSYVTVYE